MLEIASSKRDFFGNVFSAYSYHCLVEGNYSDHEKLLPHGVVKVTNCEIKRVERTCVPLYESSFDKFCHAFETSWIGPRFPY